jgi:cytochrome c-type biogenesis protein
VIDLIPSFFAGVLTVAAPCVLPLLPIILGGSIETARGSKQSKRAPIFIILGLVVSVILFTLLLKASTALLGVPHIVWQSVSAGIILLFGVTFLFPGTWSMLSLTLGLQKNSDLLLEKSSRKEGPIGSFLMGASLGPVFNSCSPTYALIIAIILPRSFSEGIAHLCAYALGLGASLLGIAFLGRSLVQRIRPLANPNSKLRKGIGILFILTALLIFTGYDKQFQAFVLEKGWYDPIANLEFTI